MPFYYGPQQNFGINLTGSSTSADPFGNSSPFSPSSAPAPQAPSGQSAAPQAQPMGSYPVTTMGGNPWDIGTPPTPPSFNPAAFRSTPGYQSPGAFQNSPYQQSQAPGQVQTPNINQQGLNAYRDFALNGNSPWLQQAQQLNTLQTQQQKDNAAALGASSTQQAQDQLAMNGGLTSGAQERTALEGQRNAQGQQQQIGAQGAQNALGLQSQAGQQQLQAMGQLPGMEIANAQPGLQAGEFNVGAGQAAANAQNTFNLQQGLAGNTYNQNNANAQNTFDLNGTNAWNQLQEDEANRQANFNQGNYGIQSSIYGNNNLANYMNQQNNKFNLFDTSTW